MANATVDLWDRLYETDPSVAHFTDRKLRNALMGFSLITARSDGWLASAVRWGIHSALRATNWRAGVKGVAAVRDEAAGLAEQVGALRKSLDAISDEAESAMWRVGFCNWLQDWVSEESQIDTPAEIESFRAVRQQLIWLERFFGQVTLHLDDEVPKKKWITANRKQLRVFFARYLAPVFEEAFGLPATHKNGGSNNDPASYGHFADFLCRVLEGAGFRDARSNLGDVLKTARLMHGQVPVSFDPRIPSE